MTLKPFHHPHCRHTHTHKHVFSQDFHTLANTHTHTQFKETKVARHDPLSWERFKNKPFAFETFFSFVASWAERDLELQNTNCWTVGHYLKITHTVGAQLEDYLLTSSSRCFHHEEKEIGPLKLHRQFQQFLRIPAVVWAISVDSLHLRNARPLLLPTRFLAWHWWLRIVKFTNSTPDSTKMFQRFLSIPGINCVRDFLDLKFVFCE
jgi:hypothetical protein